eukprot:8404497-Pyramimonas_sp.AAC.1
MVAEKWPARSRKRKQPVHDRKFQKYIEPRTVNDDPCRVAPHISYTPFTNLYQAVAATQRRRHRGETEARVHGGMRVQMK